MDAQVFLSCDSLQLETLLGHKQTWEHQDTRPVGSDHSSVQFSRSVMSDSLLPHESQHARPPYPSPTARVGVHPESTQTHVHQVSDAIQPSHPLSSPSPPALNSHNTLDTWGYIKYIINFTSLHCFKIWLLDHYTSVTLYFHWTALL